MADDDATARPTTKATKGGTAKKAAAKKAAAAPKAATSKAAPTRSAPVRKAPVKKAPVTRPAISRAAISKAPISKAPIRKAPIRKAPTKNVDASKAPVRDGGAVLAPRKKAPPALRLAAEQTFDDDWDVPAPEPEPVREDPAARVRSILRAAALSLEAREAPTARTAAPAPPAAPDEPVTRVLVAPAPPEVDEPEVDEPEADETEVDETEIEGEDDEDVEEATIAEGGWPAGEEAEGDWSPPDVLDDSAESGPPPRPQLTTPPPPPPPIQAVPATDFSTVDILPPARPTEEPPRRGAGLSILAIVLAIFGPVLGAIIAFFLAGRARKRGASLTGLARLVSVLALVGWVAGIGFLALRDQGVDYSKLKVGDCFASSESNEVRGVKVESCSKPHNSEIFFLVTSPAGPKDPYPGRDALVQSAADACLGQPLTDYLGVPLEASKLKDFEIVPQESAWKEGRRVLVCGIDTGGQGDITGSVKGTRR